MAGAQVLNGARPSPSLPILTFHAIEDGASPICFSPLLFERAMAVLHRAGFRTLDLIEALECLWSKAPLPPRSLVITFDDGYRSVYDNAFPVLCRFGFKATVFLVPPSNGADNGDRRSSFEGRPLMSWREMREMQAEGITAGAHTLNHPDLTRLPPARIEAEVAESKAAIEGALEVGVESFAYPFGRHNTAAREIVSRHFVCACTDELALTTPASSRFAVERLDTYYLRSERAVELLSSPLLPWYIRARAVPRAVRRLAGALAG